LGRLDRGSRQSDHFFRSRSGGAARQEEIVGSWLQKASKDQGVSRTIDPRIFDWAARPRSTSPSRALTRPMAWRNSKRSLASPYAICFSSATPSSREEMTIRRSKRASCPSKWGTPTKPGGSSKSLLRAWTAEKIGAGLQANADGHDHGAAGGRPKWGGGRLPPWTGTPRRSRRFGLSGGTARLRCQWQRMHRFCDLMRSGPLRHLLFRLLSLDPSSTTSPDVDRCWERRNAGRPVGARATERRSLGRRPG